MVGLGKIAAKIAGGGASAAAGAVAEVAGVFREGADAGADRDLARFEAVLSAAASEAAAPGKFGALVDGLNRLPRPCMAFGVIGLFVFAMAAPEAFAVRVSALALMPDPLWLILGGVVTFYFGARELGKARGVKAASVVADFAAWRRATGAMPFHGKNEGAK